MPGVSIRIAEIESGMLGASSAPNSSSKVSMIMVRGTSGSITSSKARAASAVEPRIRTRAWGSCPWRGCRDVRRPGRRRPYRSHPGRRAFDHGGDGRVHPAPRRSQLLTGGEPAAGRPRGHARGLAEQTEYRSLLFCESAVGPESVRTGSWGRQIVPSGTARASTSTPSSR